jgi:hypothetical protein
LTLFNGVLLVISANAEVAAWLNHRDFLTSLQSHHPDVDAVEAARGDQTLILLTRAVKTLAREAERS